MLVFILSVFVSISGYFFPPESLNESAAISPKELAKQLNLGNPAHLEKRIKRELEEQGSVESFNTSL